MTRMIAAGMIASTGFLATMALIPVSYRTLALFPAFVAWCMAAKLAERWIQGGER